MFIFKPLNQIQISRVCVVSGSDHGPEGGSVRLTGGPNAGSDEEHRPVRCLRTEGLHEGQRSHTMCLEVVLYVIEEFYLLSYLWCVGVQGLGTDEETLIEIVCSRSNDELMEIKKVYKESKKLL